MQRVRPITVAYDLVLKENVCPSAQVQRTKRNQSLALSVKEKAGQQSRQQYVLCSLFGSS